VVGLPPEPLTILTRVLVNKCGEMCLVPPEPETVRLAGQEIDTKRGQTVHTFPVPQRCAVLEPKFGTTSKSSLPDAQFGVRLVVAAANWSCQQVPTTLLAAGHGILPLRDQEHQGARARTEAATRR
jgi:hypothetical protein